MPFSDEQTDHERFAEARRCIETDTDVAEGIAVMIHLSWCAIPMQLRHWAATYLQERLNTSIEGSDNETEGKADRVS